MLKKILLLALTFWINGALGQAQPSAVDSMVYTSAATLYMAGKPFATAQPFQRVDTANYPALPAPVKRLLTHSAGLVVCFSTNSTAIAAQWCVNKPLTYANMAAINSTGLNLYVQKNGAWQYAGVGRPGKQLCQREFLVQHLAPGEKRFLLYLPTYNELNTLEIGVAQGSLIKPVTNLFNKRIVVYGSSITQGASASRAGMAYPAILSRSLGYDFVNVGLSGSAKMEPEVIKLLNDIPNADAYVLDCIPNASAQQIKERLLNMVKAIQAAHPGKPVILINTVLREQGFTDTKLGESVNKQSAITDSLATILIKAHTKDFYFIDAKTFLGDDHEGTTDGTHPNDLGMYRFATRLQPLLTNILKKYF